MNGDTTHPLVSVVMPVYNRERFLSEAVDSILSQTFSELELILVDDGSTDRSVEIIKTYMQQDPRVRLITQENSGPAIARNNGIIASRSDYVAFMDDDDVSAPDRIEKLYSFLKSNPGVRSVNSERAPLNKTNSGSIPGDNKPPHRLFKNSVQPHNPDLASFLDGRGRNFAVGSNSMVIKKDILELGGFRSLFSCNEDTDMTLRFEEKFNMGAIPLPLYLQRSHETPGRVSTTRNSWVYLSAAFISAHMRRTTGSDPVNDTANINDILSLFSHLPDDIQSHLKRKLVQKWKRETYKAIQYNQPGSINSITEEIMQYLSSTTIHLDRKSINHMLLKSILRAALGLRLNIFTSLLSIYPAKGNYST